MKTTYKTIRFVGVLGAAWILGMLIVVQIMNTHAGASGDLKYVLTVTIPYGLVAIFLVLPYSRMERRLWRGCLALLSLTGAYVLVYLLSHLPAEEWFVTTAFTVLLLSQIIAISLSRRAVPNKTGAANGSLPFRSA